MCVFRDSLRSSGWHCSAAPTLIGCWPLSLVWMGSHLGTFHSHWGLSVAAAGEIAFLFPYNGWSELEGARVSLSLSWQWKLIPLPLAPFWNPLQLQLIRGHHETSKKLREQRVWGQASHMHCTLPGWHIHAWTNTSAKKFTRQQMSLNDTLWGQPYSPSLLSNPQTSLLELYLQVLGGWGLCMQNEAGVWRCSDFMSI